METTDASVMRRVYVASLFCASLVLFLATSSFYAVPGESTSYLVQHAGLDAFPPMTHVVWGWIVRTLGALHLGPLALLPNLFSALCGAGCIALVAILVSRLSYNVDFEITSSSVRVLAGVAAAAAAAVAAPMWFVSNRAHPLSMDVLLLLASLYFLGRYRDGARRADLYTFGLLQSLAIADFSTCLATAIPVGCYVLILMKRHGHLRPGPILGIASCAVPLVLIYLVAAWQYSNSPAAGWREFESFLQILKFFPREQWLEAKQDLLRQGWLVTFVCAVVPWAVCLYINRRGGFIEGGAGSYLLHSLMFAVSILVLLNGPATPWTREPETLLVTPCLMAATCFGYSAGYGLALLIHRFRSRPRRGVALASCLTALVVVLTGFANAPVVSTASARDVHTVARAMVDDLGTRRIVVTQGLLDDSLLVEARDAGLPLAIVNAEKSRGLAYRRYVASLVPASRLRAVAKVGFTPMLSEWMRNEPDVETRLAMQASPDMWLLTGFQVIPRGSVYLGAKRVAKLDVDAVMKERRAFWQAAVPPLRAIAGRSGPEQKMAVDGLAWLSHLANDLGILMENLERPDEAEEAYRAAADFNAGNVVCRVNLHDLYVRRGESNRADVVWSAVSSRSNGPGSTTALPVLLERHGHIRTQAAFDRFASLRAAEDAIPVPEDPDVARALALFGEKKLDEARAVVERLVETKPEEDRAWIVLAAIAYDQRDEKAVQRCFTRMRAEKKEWPQLFVIMGQLALQREDYLSAREYLEAAAQHWPASEDILEKLISIYLRDGARRRLEYAVRNLLFINPDHPAGNYALGRMLMESKEEELAADAYQRVTFSAYYPMAQAQLAELLRRKGQLDVAFVSAQRAVELNPGLAEGWETLGKIYEDQKKPEDAVRALAKARELTPARNLTTGKSESAPAPAEPFFATEPAL